MLLNEHTDARTTGMVCPKCSSVHSSASGKQGKRAGRQRQVALPVPLPQLKPQVACFHVTVCSVQCSCVGAMVGGALVAPVSYLVKLPQRVKVRIEEPCFELREKPQSPNWGGKFWVLDLLPVKSASQRGEPVASHLG